MKDVVTNTDSMAYDSISFQITMANESMLNALIHYSEMLDYVTHSKDDELLNIDGLINSLIAEGMTKRIKDIVKRHSFEDMEEFINCMAECHDGEEVLSEVKQHESSAYQKMHDEILSHIPVDDAQRSLPFVVKGEQG